jgi:hypothetical protein
LPGTPSQLSNATAGEYCLDVEQSWARACQLKWGWLVGVGLPGAGGAAFVCAAYVSLAAVDEGRRSVRCMVIKCPGVGGAAARARSPPGRPHRSVI